MNSTVKGEFYLGRAGWPDFSGSNSYVSKLLVIKNWMQNEEAVQPKSIDIYCPQGQ